MSNKKFWQWKDVSTVLNEETKEEKHENVLILNGPIAEESWFGDEITPEDFREELEAHKGAITVWINSPGGDCIAAARIYNMLVDHKGKITVKIDGIAASAASVIAMAGDKVLMGQVSILMIHNPMTMAMGNRADMEQAIETLDAVKESIMNAYEQKTGLRRSKISELMDNETWMDSKTALEYGFCDGIITREEQEKIEESLEAQMFQKKVVEATLTNKLAEKYLIKKVEDNTKENEPAIEGTPIDVINTRLDGMKKLM